MIPLDKDGMRDLLELKNIALLYKLWTFFRLVHEISAVLGRPPIRSGRLSSGPFQTGFAAGGTFEWDSGVRLVYNQRFFRSRTGQGTPVGTSLGAHPRTGAFPETATFRFAWRLRSGVGDLRVLFARLVAPWEI